MSNGRKALHNLRNAVNSVKLAVMLLPGSDAAEAIRLLELVERQAGEGEAAAETLLELGTEWDESHSPQPAAGGEEGGSSLLGRNQ